MGLPGFNPIPDCPSVCSHDGLKLLLVICVGGLKVAGPKADLGQGWGLTRSEIDIEDLTPPGVFAGCIREQFSYINEHGREI